MSFSDNYHNRLLYLAHFVISADGIIDESELKALDAIKGEEENPDEVFAAVSGMREKEIYQRAIDLISTCDDEERLRVYCWLRRISEAGDSVHVKEVSFLLYSMKRANMAFDDLVEAAKEFPHII